MTTTRDLKAFGAKHRNNPHINHRVNDSLSLLNILRNATDPVHRARIMKQLGMSTREIAEVVGRVGGRAL